MTNDQNTSNETTPKVLRRTVIKISLAGAAAGADGASASGTAGATGAAAQEEEASVVFAEQTIDGTSLTIESATLPEGGFISVQKPSLAGEEWGRQHELDYFELVVLGATEYLEPGTHENVELESFQQLEESNRYQVMLHPDTNGSESFDFIDSKGEEDFGYFFLANNPVVGDAYLTIDEDIADDDDTGDDDDTSDDDDDTDDDTSDDDDDTSDDSSDDTSDETSDDTADDDGPGFGVVTALAGLGLGAAEVVRRKIRKEE